MNYEDFDPQTQAILRDSPTRPGDGSKQVPQEEKTIIQNARSDERWFILQWVQERLRDYQSLPELGATDREMYLEAKGRVNQLKELECYLSQR